MKKLTSEELREEMKLHGFLTGCLWHKDDIDIFLADELGLEYTEKDVDEIANDIERHFDASIGITWDSIEAACTEHFNSN